MNKISFLLVIAVLASVVVVSGCTTEAPIGGERDEHGCLGPAGYSWDEDVGACLRSWELDDDQKRAAKEAVEYVGYEKGLTILSADAGECEGCFVVHLEKGQDRVAVTTENWEATGRTVELHFCTEEEKQADVCTMEYAPVCGYLPDGGSDTYSNGCLACSVGVEYWENGECAN